MSSKEQMPKTDKASSAQRLPKSASKSPARQQSHPATIIQRAEMDPSTLTQADIIQLQRTIGNQAVTKLLNIPNQYSKVNYTRKININKVIQRELDHNLIITIKNKVNQFESSTTGMCDTMALKVKNKLLNDKNELGIEQIGGISLAWWGFPFIFEKGTWTAFQHTAATFKKGGKT